MEQQPRLLVVEDEELLRQIIARALRREGCSCDCAENGLEAVALSRAAPYDLILTDLAMPVLDGFDFIRRVRASGPNAATPILVVSCRDLDPDEFLREYDVQGYLQKPFSLEGLLQRVEAALGRSPALVGAPASANPDGSPN